MIELSTVAVLLAGRAAAWPQQPAVLPPGWSVRRMQTLRDPTGFFARKGLTGIYVTGDFDGDGLQDRAELLINRADQVYALVFTGLRRIRPDWRERSWVRADRH